MTGTFRGVAQQRLLEFSDVGRGTVSLVGGKLPCAVHGVQHGTFWSVELGLGPGATVSMLRGVECFRLETVFAVGSLGESHAGDAFLSCQLEFGHA